METTLDSFMYKKYTVCDCKIYSFMRMGVTDIPV